MDINLLSQKVDGLALVHQGRMKKERINKGKLWCSTLETKLEL